MASGDRGRKDRDVADEVAANSRFRVEIGSRWVASPRGEGRTRRTDLDDAAADAGRDAAVVVAGSSAFQKSALIQLSRGAEDEYNGGGRLEDVVIY